MTNAEAVVELVELEVILPLRHAVLRPGRPFESAINPEDGHPQALHFAVRDPAGAPIGCASFYPAPLDGPDDWVFRGMATDAEYRGRGIGGLVLETGIAEVARRGADLVWCKGRTTAVPFYRRHGFQPRGEEFVVPISGPHYLLVRDLSASPPA